MAGGPLLDLSTGEPDFGLIHVGNTFAVEDAIRLLWFDLIAMNNAAGLRITPFTQYLQGKVLDTAPGSVNDLDTGATLVVQLNNGSASNVSGFRNGRDGLVKVIYNRGAGTVTLQHNNSGSAAGNRLWNAAQTDLSVVQYKSAIYYYSAIQSQWNQVSLA